MDQVNIHPQSDPLHEYRIGKLEEAYASMSDALGGVRTELAALLTEAKLAKWVIGLFLAVVQPVVVYFLTK